MVWKIFNFLSKKHKIKQEQKAFVILGFQRSGTSLLGQILHTLGVSFGDVSDMKKIDFRNPKGFYENERVFGVLRRMLKQAGVKDEFGVSTSLEAKGFFARVGRAFARISLQKELSLLSNIGTPWAVKSFPILFYYLKSYVPKSTKIIAIYRHPLAVAESFMKAWEGGRYSFDQVIELWSRANKDMLYHLSGRESVLVCYEDLFIPEKNEKMLQTLKDFVGSNASLDELKKVLDPALNRSSKKADELAKNYVLSGEAQETYRILNKLKI